MEYQVTVEQIFRNLAVVGAGFGIVIGLVPLALGFSRSQKRLGIIGFIVTVITGAVLFLLAIIPAAVFSWLIVRAGRAAHANTQTKLS